MKNRVPEDVRKAIGSLQGHPPFKTITKWFEDSLQEARESNDILEGIELTRSQGEAIVLNKIVKALRSEE